ncbi:metal-dependent hydrolase [Pseudodesulfovibrio tunisiensis]|uniref:metal-dependent hydrolase n=1 Tax=Pseudodesulfovibrio tunisiensis TaxID=463192 RepID=UPI001FB26FEC|nr:metal-dependent hydrolase [Pseudodesulfovibrio tunisiensis]
MDPVTHLASGILGAQAARRWFSREPLLYAFCIAAALLPDADVLFTNSNPEHNLLYHRGVSTSLFGWPIMAMILSALYKPFTRSASYGKILVLALFVILLHIWLDLITSYGTQLLAPFSTQRFTLDGVFIIDPFYTGVMLLCIIVGAFWQTNRKILGMLGLIWIVAYPLWNMATAERIHKRLSRELAWHGETYDRLHVLPDALSPIYWKIIRENGDGYSLTTLNLLDEDREYPDMHFNRASSEELEHLGKQESMFNTFAWFARWPFRDQQPRNENTLVTFGDVRFISTNPVLARLMENRKPPFTLEAVIAPDGTLLEWHFHRSRSTFSRRIGDLP